MPDRREVMIGGLLGCALGAMPAHAAHMIHASGTAILIGNGFVDGARFLDGCDSAGHTEACDVAITALTSGSFDTPRVIAIAQQSDTFILRQLLREAGYRPAFSADHFRDGGRIEHRISGEAGFVKAVASGLSRTGANWASALALHLLKPGLPNAGALSSGKIATPAHVGPAYLSSFLFERAPA